MNHRLKSKLKTIGKMRMPTSDKPEWNFRMCKYCGGRITTGVNRWGRKAPDGAYCSTDCAGAVHGFDNRLASERNRTLVSFDINKHDRICEATPTPDQAVMDAEDGGLKPIRRMDPPTEAEIFDAAEDIDPRLPGILAGLKKGRTQEEMARRVNLSPGRMSQLLAMLRSRFCA